jgi:N-acetyl-anhydromuramyl-L-alanine amidase AmpD
MTELFFTLTDDPKTWANDRRVCHGVVTTAPWERVQLTMGGLTIKGRRSWGAAPIWKNEVVYYNLAISPLQSILNKIVVHHTNNSDSILENERKQQARGYAALGYHFFIDKEGEIYEGRPLEIMGSHAGTGAMRGPLNDPDWGAVGIVLQGDYHHDDDWFFKSKAPQKQLSKLEKLVLALRNRYAITQLLMHREIARSGKATVCPGSHMVPHIVGLRKKLGMLGAQR